MRSVHGSIIEVVAIWSKAADGKILLVHITPAVIAANEG